MKSFLVAIIFVFLIVFTNESIFAVTPERGYYNYVNIWNDNIDLAGQLLREAELLLKDGELIKGCEKQSKASAYGVKAFKALMKASTLGEVEYFSQLELESGLNKWKELGQFCRNINMKTL